MEHQQAKPSYDLAKVEGHLPVSTSIFSDSTQFEFAQRVANALIKSDLVPQHFKGNLPNALIALDMSNRLGANPLAVMQSIYIVHGKPSWSATFIIAMINSCGRFEPLRFELTGSADSRSCVAWTRQMGGQDRLESPAVTMDMARKEGWFGKQGSKWQTMPELMLRYRAATFFGRLYCPELLLGMQTAEEVIDVEGVEIRKPRKPNFGPALFAEAKAPVFDATPEPPAQAPEPTQESPQQPNPRQDTDPGWTAPKAQPALAKDAKDRLAEIITGAGYNWDQFKAFLVKLGDTEAADLPGFSDMDGRTARKYVNAAPTILKELGTMFPEVKEGELNV